jgi:hypothetical protein
MPVRIIGPRDIPPREAALPRADLVNTTSHSPKWKGLSPFYIGPVALYEGAVCVTATNVENGWQYSKVYEGHLGPGNLPAPLYYEWAREGWSNPRAQRYPMGKGKRPAFSWWAGEALDYIEARKRIYFPMYAKAVVKTQAFENLLNLYRSTGNVTLWDFDGYDHRAFGMTYKDVLNDPARKMGHAFVLGYLLENWKGDDANR